MPLELVRMPLAPAGMDHAKANTGDGHRRADC